MTYLLGYYTATASPGVIVSSSVAEGVLQSIAGPYSFFLTVRDLDRFKSIYSSNCALAIGSNIPKFENAKFDKREECTTEHGVSSTSDQRLQNTSYSNLGLTPVPPSSQIGDGEVHWSFTESDSNLASKYSSADGFSRLDEEYVDNMENEKSKVITNTGASMLASEDVRTRDLGVLVMSSLTDKYGSGTVEVKEEMDCTMISRAKSDICFDLFSDIDEKEYILPSSGRLRAQGIDTLPSSSLKSEKVAVKKEGKLNDSECERNFSLNSPFVIGEDDTLIDIDIEVNRAATLKRYVKTSEDPRERGRYKDRNRLQDRNKHCVRERLEEQIEIKLGCAGDTRGGSEEGESSENLYEHRIQKDDDKNEDRKKDVKKDKDEYINVHDDVTATFR